MNESDQQSAAGTFDLQKPLYSIFRRRWVAGGVFVAVTGLAVLLTVRADRIYRGSALVLIERAAPKVLSEMNDVYDLGATGYWSTQEYYQTQYNVIRSRPVAQAVVNALGLDTKEIATALTEAPESSEAALAGDPLHGVDGELRQKIEILGLQGMSSRQDLVETLPLVDPVLTVQGRIEAVPIRDSRLVRVEVEDRNPQIAALLSNTAAEAYIKVNLDQKIEMTSSAVEWLSDQMRDLKAKLEASEIALHDFKAANKIVSVSLEDRQSMTAQTLGQLNQSLSETKADRLALDSRLEQIRQSATSDAIEEAIDNRLIQGLKTNRSELRQQESELILRYTDEHPKVIAVRKKLRLVEADLQREIDKVVASIQRQFNAARDTESRLSGAINEAKGGALDLNRKEIAYKRLKREADNNEALYQIVLKRHKEADLSRMLNVNNVRLLEAAVPPTRPIRPRVFLNLLVGLILGVFISFGTALLVDHLDNSIKSQEQLEQTLGLPFLGMVPSIKLEAGAAEGPQERDQYIVANPRSSVAECCRTIRTNLLFMSPDTPLRTLLITSNGPREGKSTAVVNLAITMAQSGNRTVIVDTDMRRPRIHKSFGLASDVGISNVIVGDVELTAATQPSGIERLDVLPCGPIPPNPAELLHTERFASLLEELLERYDRVVFDSPPVGAVTDALVLASMTDGVVLVVQAGQTSTSAAQLAKRRLQDVGGRIFGVVLNDVDLESKSYGSYYQYYHYRAGYGEDGKREPAKRAS